MSAIPELPDTHEVDAAAKGAHDQLRQRNRPAGERMSRPILKPVFGLLTIAASALVGAMVKDWWEAPRPDVELSAVELRHIGDPATRVDVLVELRGRISDHVYVEDLGDSLTVKDIRDSIDAAEEDDARFGDLARRAEKLGELVRSRPATALNVNDRRLEFLKLWYEGDQGENLATFARVILQSAENALPPHYQRHPADAPQWVELATGTQIALYEVDETMVDARERRQLHGLNLLRRMWIYMEPDVLADVLARSKVKIEQEIASSRAICTELQTVIDRAQPERLVATTVVTNKGGRPLALRNVGVLFLKFAGAGGAETTLPVDMRASGNSDVMVVAPGTVAVVELTSRQSVSQLTEEHTVLRGESGGRSKLKPLFEGGGISAAIVLARAGASATEAAMTPTSFRPAGAKGDDMILEALKRRKPQ